MDGINRYSLNISNDKSSSALTDEAKQIALIEQKKMIKDVDESQKKKLSNEKLLRKTKMKKNLSYLMNILMKTIKIKLLMNLKVNCQIVNLAKYFKNMTKMICKFI
ncbi:MAG: hypothetical protein L6V95_06875 [Candidatus Melainabacteria bacterium]|nr:MAG: hypothetical protein L6V95_06875 [Candidatus Melainabacteria bacterium]